MGAVIFLVIVAFVALYALYDSACDRINELRRELSGLQAERDILKYRVDELTELRDDVYRRLGIDRGDINEDDDE